MAYVRMPSVADSIVALIRLHNHHMKSRYLRVSFSGKDANSVSENAPVANEPEAQPEAEEQAAE